jgi:hypothetical protein
MQVDGSLISKPPEANPFPIKVVHGVRQDVSVDYNTLLFGE